MCTLYIVATRGMIHRHNYGWLSFIRTLPSRNMSKSYNRNVSGLSVVCFRALSERPVKLLSEHYTVIQFHAVEILGPNFKTLLQSLIHVLANKKYQITCILLRVCFLIFYVYCTFMHDIANKAFSFQPNLYNSCFLIKIKPSPLSKMHNWSDCDSVKKIPFEM